MECIKCGDSGRFWCRDCTAPVCEDCVEAHDHDYDPITTSWVEMAETASECDRIVAMRELQFDTAIGYALRSKEAGDPVLVRLAWDISESLKWSKIGALEPIQKAVSIARDTIAELKADPSLGVVGGKYADEAYRLEQTLFKLKNVQPFYSGIIYLYKGVAVNGDADATRTHIDFDTETRVVTIMARDKRWRPARSQSCLVICGNDVITASPAVSSSPGVYTAPFDPNRHTVVRMPGFMKQWTPVR